MPTPFTLGAFALIFDKDNRILLCHRRDKDIWNQPGGGVNELESPWDAVIREVKEEVGLDVKVEYLEGVYSKNYENDLVFNFVCSVVSGSPTKTSEADQIEYFSIDKLPQNTHQHHRERIQNCNKVHNKILLEIQGAV